MSCGFFITYNKNSYIFYKSNLDKYRKIYTSPLIEGIAFISYIYNKGRGFIQVLLVLHGIIPNLGSVVVISQPEKLLTQLALSYASSFFVVE
jgi:hypothetical protein